VIQLLIVACCVFACPLLTGGTTWVVGRDHRAAKLGREIRRLNRDAARQPRAVTVNPAPREARNSPCTGLNSGRDLGSRAEAPGARANGEMPSMHPVA
jgi:hypothetical protein